MNDRNEIQKRIWSKSNISIVATVYLVLLIYLSIFIFRPDNLATPDIFSKISVLLIVLFIFAPVFSICILLFRLRIQHLLELKNFTEFLFPPKGSIANPYLEDLFGHKAKKILSYLLGIIIVSIILFIIAVSVLRYH
jgi:hypothetical protein